MFMANTIIFTKPEAALKIYNRFGEDL